MQNQYLIYIYFRYRSSLTWKDDWLETYQHLLILDIRIENSKDLAQIFFMNIQTWLVFKKQKKNKQKEQKNTMHLPLIYLFILILMDSSFLVPAEMWKLFFLFLALICVWHGQSKVALIITEPNIDRKASKVSEVNTENGNNYKHIWVTKWVTLYWPRWMLAKQDLFLIY